MDFKKVDIHDISSKALDIASYVKWAFAVFITVALFLLSKAVYPLFTDPECWTCSVFENVYNAYSLISMQTFALFQKYILAIISVCFALWIVYKTFQIMQPAVFSFLYPVESVNLGQNYYKAIYKKIFLVVAILGLFIFNSPRNIFSNTFEITLDFGTAISRYLLRAKLSEDKVPKECVNQNSKIEYKDGMALSENTKNNMMCMMKEVNNFRHSYVDLGIAMFEYGLKPMIATLVGYIAIRVSFFFGGRYLKNYGGKKWFKNMDKKIDDYTEKIKNSATSPEKKQKYEKILRNLKDKLKKEVEEQKNGGKKTEKLNKVGEKVQDWNKLPASIMAIVAILTNDDVKMGIAGLGILIGFYIINMFFAFIIVEYMLFLGIAIILFPVLAASYIFEQTRQYATVALSQTFSFSLRLIFTCIAMVICAEINDNILGGALTGNLNNPADLVAILKSGHVQAFNAAVGTSWYVLYVFIAIFLNAVIMKEVGSVTKWFNGDASSDSKLLSPLLSMGKSGYDTAKSVVKEVRTYRKFVDDDKSKNDKKNNKSMLDRINEDIQDDKFKKDAEL